MDEEAAQSQGRAQMGLRWPLWELALPVHEKQSTSLMVAVWPQLTHSTIHAEKPHWPCLLPVERCHSRAGVAEAGDTDQLGESKGSCPRGRIIYQ